MGSDSRIRGIHVGMFYGRFNTFLIRLNLIVQKLKTVAEHFNIVQCDRFNIHISSHQIPLQYCPYMQHNVSAICSPCTDEYINRHVDGVSLMFVQITFTFFVRNLFLESRKKLIFYLIKANWKQCISFPCSKLDRIEVFADILEGGSFAGCLYCLRADENFDKLTVDAFVAKVVFVFPVKLCSVV